MFKLTKYEKKICNELGGAFSVGFVTLSSFYGRSLVFIMYSYIPIQNASWNNTERTSFVISGTIKPLFLICFVLKRIGTATP
jgi:hypothetical protein